MTRFTQHATLIWKITIVSAAALLMNVLATSLQAADDCCPTETPAVATLAQSDAKTLPEGHPPMPSASDALPEGHPPMPETAVDQEPFQGTLVIKAIQGTTDGPTLGGESATIAFYQKGKVISEREVQLDDKGAIILDDLDFVGVVQPVVTIEREGIRFEAIGQPMGARKPDQIIRVMSYEVTQDQPAWYIAMRHVMIRRIEGGLHVTDMISMTNPKDRAWKGAPSLAKDAEVETAPTTFAISLPAEAKQVTATKGFGNHGARIDIGQLSCTMPMLPGTSEYHFTYVLPADDGKVVLDVVAPAKVSHLMIFVPDNGKEITTEGLSIGESFRTNETLVRVFQAQNVEAEKNIKLTIDAEAPSANPKAPAQPADANGHDASASAGVSMPKIVAGVGAGVLLIGSVAILAIRAKAA